MVYGKDIKIRKELLTDKTEHYTKGFICENDAVDHFIKYIATNDDSTVTYLYIDTEEDMLVAFVTIVCSAVFLTLSEDEQESTIIPSVEIKYFAVNNPYKHMRYEKNSPYTLSHEILIDSILHIRNISHTTIGAKQIILYSVPRAINFYTRCRFEEFREDMYGDLGYFVDGCTPMYLEIN